MSATSIEWTDFSVNPIRARLAIAAAAGITKGGYASGIGHYCEKISPGCALCYASGTQPRFGVPEFPGVQKRTGLDVLQNATGDRVSISDKMEVFFDGSRLIEVLKRKKPTRFFWCDMSDLFGAWVPDAWIDRCMTVMHLTPWHTHQVLTKRVERMADYLLTPGRAERIFGDWFVEQRDRGPAAKAWKKFNGFGGVDPNYHPSSPLARRNIWLGTSVENQKCADERSKHLRRCPAAVRFYSVEPLLGPIARLPLHRISWVIVGGESGHGARPCVDLWIRSIIDQCRAASVPVFVKQLGSLPYGETGMGCEVPFKLKSKKGGDPEEWPAGLRVREMPGEVVRR